MVIPSSGIFVRKSQLNICQPLTKMNSRIQNKINNTPRLSILKIQKAIFLLNFSTFYLFIFLRVEIACTHILIAIVIRKVYILKQIALDNAHLLPVLRLIQLLLLQVLFEQVVIVISALPLHFRLPLIQPSFHR